MTIIGSFPVIRLVPGCLDQTLVTVVIVYTVGDHLLLQSFNVIITFVLWSFRVISPQKNLVLDLIGCLI